MDQFLPHLERIEARLCRVQDSLDRVLNGPPPEIINVTQAMKLTGCGSEESQYRWFKRFNVKPYMRGKYRRVEITNAIGRAQLQAATEKAISLNP